MAHAKLLPCSTPGRMSWPGSVAMSEGIADKSSSHADEGTAAHEMAERILLGELGTDLIGLKAENGVAFTAAMLEGVMVYVDMVRDLVKSTGGTLYVEQKLSIEHLTGEPGAKGTSDCVIDAGDELIVGDLKFGMGVRVDADDNEQLMIYALAALEKFSKATVAAEVEDLL